MFPFFARRPGRGRPAARPKSPRRPALALEALEARWVPSTFAGADVVSAPPAMQALVGSNDTSAATPSPVVISSTAGSNTGGPNGGSETPPIPYPGGIPNNPYLDLPLPAGGAGATQGGCGSTPGTAPAPSVPGALEAVEVTYFFAPPTQHDVAADDDAADHDGDDCGCTPPPTTPPPPTTTTTNCDCTPPSGPGSLSGIVYVDGNQSGHYAQGDILEQGVTVNLTGQTLDGQSVSQTTTTDANGHYSFGNLAPGVYQLVDVLPAGYTPGAATLGSLGGLDQATNITQLPPASTPGNAVPLNLRLFQGYEMTVALPQGGQGMCYDFGLVPSAPPKVQSTGSLSGIVYLDVNQSGQYVQGDPLEQGVPVNLTGQTLTGQSVSLRTTTDGNGSYSFGSLAPGVYNLSDVPPQDIGVGPDTLGSLGGLVQGNQMIVNLPQGGNGVSYDFSLVPPPLNLIHPIITTPPTGSTNTNHTSDPGPQIPVTPTPAPSKRFLLGETWQSLGSV